MIENLSPDHILLKTPESHFDHLDLVIKFYHNNLDKDKIYNK